MNHSNFFISTQVESNESDDVVEEDDVKDDHSYIILYVI